MAAEHLHPAVFGVVVASIFAAIMSTADSQLLVAASSAVRDFYEKVMRRGDAVDDRRLVLLSRTVVLLLVLVALALGLMAENLVFWLVLFAWAGLGPTAILALYSRTVTRAGVFAGLVTGTLVTIVWYLTPALKSRLYELIPAFALSLLATWAVSRWSRPPDGVDSIFEALER